MMEQQKCRFTVKSKYSENFNNTYSIRVYSQTNVLNNTEFRNCSYEWIMKSLVNLFKLTRIIWRDSSNLNADENETFLFL